MRFLQFFPTHGRAGESLYLRSTNIRIDHIVDRYGGSAIAAAQAGDFTNLHLCRARCRKSSFEVRSQFTRAVQVAAHVCANANIGARRRRQTKVGIETGHTMNLVKRRMGTAGKGFKLRTGKKSVAKLDGPQVVEDHGASPCTKKRRTERERTERRKVEFKPVAIRPPGGRINTSEY